MPLLYSFIYLQIADVDFCINGTEFKFYVKPYFLGELETPSISNWNLEMPFFEETRKLGYMEKKYLQTEITSQKLTASLAWVWHRLRDVNPGHTGGRQSHTQSLLAFWSVIPVVTLLTKKPEDSGTGTRLGGRLLLHLFISPAHHSRNSRASGEGDGEAPPAPLSQRFKFNAWSGNNLATNFFFISRTN